MSFVDRDQLTGKILKIESTLQQNVSELLTTCVCVCQRAATISSSAVEPDATVSHSVKSVTETMTVMTAVTRPIAVRNEVYHVISVACHSYWTVGGLHR